MSTDSPITEAVRERYASIAADLLADKPTSGCCGSDCCGTAASASTARASSGCCGSDCCGGTVDNGISINLYELDEMGEVPLKAALASLGCGNPTALAALKPGETVLDLGSGGGIDVLLSARRVGPEGFAYGLDMTDEMLELARRNAAEAGATNVEFLKGTIDAIPLPDGSIDVVISNCVINLAADKEAVLREAYRVLRPGGRFAVSDIVIEGGLPEGVVDSAEMRRDLSAWAGCIAGALTDAEYIAGLEAAGFREIVLEVTRRYTLDDLPTPHPAWLTAMGEASAVEIVGRFVSMAVRATR